MGHTPLSHNPTSSGWSENKSSALNLSLPPLSPLLQGVQEAANYVSHYLGNALLQKARRGPLSLTVR